VRPKVNAFGHIHEAYGIEKIDDTLFINSSSVNYHYCPGQLPVVFIMDKKTKRTRLVKQEDWGFLKSGENG